MWPTSPRIGRHCIALCGGGALGSALSFFSCSGRSTSLDASSGLGSGYSAGSLANIVRYISLSHQNIGESTQVSSCYSLHHYSEMSLQSSVFPNTKEIHASYHLWTLHDAKAPCQVYLTARDIIFGLASSRHMGSIKWTFPFGIGMSGLALAGFDCNCLFNIRAFGGCIIQCATTCSASLSAVWIACITLFSVEYNVSAPCFSITELSSGSSGTPESSHVVC